jgi:outer membrane protein
MLRRVRSRISRACLQSNFAQRPQTSESSNPGHPTFRKFGNLTAVEANGDTAVAAGALTTSSISTRAAGGASLVQMITDFGHTSNLVQSARFEARAADRDEESIRQSILMQVQEAYFSAQAAESVRRQHRLFWISGGYATAVSALAQSQLRSTLDVQFAQVMVSEAELAVVRAESNVQKTQAQLAASMGEEGEANYIACR